MSLIIGFIIGIVIASILDGLAFVFILKNPSILHKLVKILPGDLVDRWEGEFDVGFYGDDCCQGECDCQKSDDDTYNRTME